VAALVVLRLSLGCHFLYEGWWKVKNADIFSAAPFLSEAKGPFAPLYYSMLPDLEGRERLGIVEEEDSTSPSGKKFAIAAEKDDKGKPAVADDKGADGKLIEKYRVYKLDAFVNAWKGFLENVDRSYGLTTDQKQQAEALLDKYVVSAREYVTDNEEEIVSHFESRKRFAADQKAGNNGAAHQREGAWKRERVYRSEANKWLANLEGMGKDYQEAVWEMLTPEQRANGQFSKGWNVLAWGRGDQINFAVTFALTAIGLCLMLGFFTRLAALGGAAFMLNVVLTQPAWPGLYPPDPAVVGHAMLINKDFIEMVALAVIATTAVGRWGGLDYFVHNLVVRPLFCKTSTTEKKEG
jgi:uncharacterized membrane protein YphA (DoxX/SURF4 family)